MKNFDYLRDIEALRTLYTFCNTAEETQRTDFNKCALNARCALEWIVKAVYEMKHIVVDPQDSLYELMEGEPFTALIANDELMMAAHYVRKVGNIAAHTGDVKGGQAFFTLLNLYNLVGGILLRLKVLDTLAPFDRSLIPEYPSPHVSVTGEPQPSFGGIAAEDDTPKYAISNNFSEADTRKYFIDLMLEEADWEVLTTDGCVLPSKACVEVELLGMPNNENKGFADYVLFGAGGKPLAVVEAKRTTKDPVVGRHQAELYADCLERQYGVRPVIYYTNGYVTWIIDGLGYPPRKLFGFHTEEDLNILVQRRSRQDIRDLRINDAITDREYQRRAIHAVCEHFNTKHRRGLLVMATGTGKTRVAISLTDVLMRNGWAKNVLFLADRNALVKQAHKNFVKLMPQTTTCILSGNNAPDMNARLMFCTYQTMINYIDTDVKEFSVGRFDLIIVDEAHRSVFGKYKSILDYFDALIVGLTATPRDEVDRSTYELFGMEDGQPNFAYELDEAVADGYLVSYAVLPRTSIIVKEGIKYDNLSPEEKEQMQTVWRYEMAIKNIFFVDKPEDNDNPYLTRDIRANEIFKYIYNTDTIDKVLQDLMEHGLKVNGGDVLGKTIIFGYNHQHADLIVERFNTLYPHLGSDFCVLIDNYVNYAQDLIESFEVRGKMPQIAVSVDMLDTGVDVPDILNLVFFKPVHSPIKFWQMIGRGTRLSADIFDEGVDKQEFFIFDWCGNFEYFGKNPKGKEPLPQISLAEKLFGLRCELACALQHQQYQQDAFAKQLHDDIKTLLKGQVRTLNDHHITVRSKWETVVKYRSEQTWEYISTLDVEELKSDIAPLLIKNITDEGAKRFDILLLNIQLSLVDEDHPAENSKVLVMQTAQALQDQASIPQVMAKMDLINRVAAQPFWEHLSLSLLEQVRVELRDLIKFLPSVDHRTFTLNITDVVEGGVTATVAPRTTYRQRVIDYLAQHRELPVLQKILHIEQLTRDDIVELERICWRELGTREEYDAYVAKGRMLCGDKVAAFIRAQIGVDRVVAVRRYAEFLAANTLNAMQEEYLKTIITYVCENGDITRDTLVNDAPFADYDWLDIFGQHLPALSRYVDNLHQAILA